MEGIQPAIIGIKILCVLPYPSATFEYLVTYKLVNQYYYDRRNASSYRPKNALSIHFLFFKENCIF